MVVDKQMSFLKSDRDRYDVEKSNAGCGGLIDESFHRCKRHTRGNSSTCVSRICLVFTPRFIPMLVLIITMHLPQTSPKELQDLMCAIWRNQLKCEQMLNETRPTTDLYCPGGYDKLICWPHGEPDTPMAIPCPNILYDGDGDRVAWRFCESTGKWKRRNGSEIWTLRSQCNPFLPNGTYEETTELADQDLEILLNTLTTIYRIGYGISLFCLVIALFLLIFFKKLHCTRNYIHMNLMISFIIRYVAVLVKDQVVEAQYDVSEYTDEPMNERDLATYCDEYNGVSGMMMSCRITLTLMHYAIITNYFWLLAEGVYLQLILIFALTEYKYFPIFMAFGWGGPWIPVGVWVTLRLTLDNTGCWEMTNRSISWAFRIPVILSILINFGIFVNIFRIIVMKLRAKNMNRTDYKYRLARSTLALIPLLGIHYIVFLFVTDETVGEDSISIKVKMAFDLTFTSIQGTLVAVLYCFLNGEVQTEVKKRWSTWRWKNGIPAPKSRKSSTFHSNGTTHMTSIISTQSGENTTLDVSRGMGERRESGLGSRRSTGMKDTSFSQTGNRTLQPLLGSTPNTLSVPLAVNSV